MKKSVDFFLLAPVDFMYFLHAKIRCKIKNE